PLGSSTSSSEIGGHPSRKGWDDRIRGADVIRFRSAAGARRLAYLAASIEGRSRLRSSEHNSYYEPSGFPQEMPLRFWKKEKPEKGKPEEKPAETKQKPKEKPAAKIAPPEKAPKPEPAVKKPEEKPAAPAAPPKPGEVEVFVNEAHAGPVDLGLTVGPTKGVSRKLAFLELETSADEFAFLLVREPPWDKLKNPELVVIKADQTATGGECGECGAPVGKYWSDCLKCGAVFG